MWTLANRPRLLLLLLLLAPALAADAAETKFLWARITAISVSTADPITVSAELAPINTPPGSKALDEWLNSLFNPVIPGVGPGPHRMTLRYTVTLFRVGEPWVFGLFRSADQEVCQGTFENWAERLNVLDALNTGETFRIQLGSAENTRVLSNLAEVQRSMMRLEDAPIPNCKLRIGADAEYYARIRVERHSAIIGVGFEAEIETLHARISVGESPNPEVRVSGIPPDVVRGATFRIEAELSSTKRSGAAVFTIGLSPGLTAVGWSVVDNAGSEISARPFASRRVVEFNVDSLRGMPRVAVDVKAERSGNQTIDWRLLVDTPAQGNRFVNSADVRQASGMNTVDVQGWRVERTGLRVLEATPVRWRLSTQNLELRQEWPNQPARGGIQVFNDGDTELRVTVTVRGAHFFIDDQPTPVTQHSWRIAPRDNEHVWFVWDPEAKVAQEAGTAMFAVENSSTTSVSLRGIGAVEENRAAPTNSEREKPGEMKASRGPARPGSTPSSSSSTGGGVAFAAPVGLSPNAPRLYRYEVHPFGEYPSLPPSLFPELERFVNRPPPAIGLPGLSSGGGVNIYAHFRMPPGTCASVQFPGNCELDYWRKQRYAVALIVQRPDGRVLAASHNCCYNTEDSLRVLREALPQAGSRVDGGPTATFAGTAWRFGIFTHPLGLRLPQGDLRKCDGLGGYKLALVTFDVGSMQRPTDRFPSSGWLDMKCGVFER